MRIALLPGDGIGREIVAQAAAVLRRLGLPLEMQEAPVGGAGYEASGDPLPGSRTDTYWPDASWWGAP